MALKKLVFGETVTCHHLEKRWRKDGMLAREAGSVSKASRLRTCGDGGRNRMKKPDSWGMRRRLPSRGWVLGLATTTEEGGTNLCSGGTAMVTLPQADEV